MELHLRAMRCHYMGSYLPPNTSEHTPPYPLPEASTRFTYPGGMVGWVELGERLHTEMVYPPTDCHSSKY